MTQQPTPEAERNLKSFHQSKARIGFWLRAIFTLSLYYWIYHRRNRIDLTTRRVVQHRATIFSDNETSILLSNVTDVTLNRSTLGRMLNYGDIMVSSAGSSGSEISARALAGADNLRAAIFDLRDGRLDESKL
ncbi:MAG TPA: PH domain-containing protein [Candidatus Limnocylindrales bacterium]|nr:PH domain-containing protein [Candidatus Limnocylindrales bacterium]